jgi:2',3'-cyclic-nucleotide 2'-phosphodiesterase / 3'-nucleotidase / 5'-nucleotidase
MRTPILRYLPAVLCLSLQITVAPAVRGETARLTVLHTTDLHGALTAFDYADDRPASRGLVRIASLVRAAREEGTPVLLLDDGDAIQGGALETAYWRGDRARPEPMMTAMTRLGYDAMAIGNHEFSWGPDALAAARAAAGFPWLAANAVRADDGRPAFGTSVVKELGGVRVGIIGLTTPAIPALEDSANVAGLRFLSPVEAGNAEAKRLRETERCDLVIVLAHTGLEKDPASGIERQGDAADENWGFRLGQELQGVDLLVLGHTHTTVNGAAVGGTFIVQAGHQGEALGRVDVELTRATPAERWHLGLRRARTIAVTDSVPADAALEAFAAPYHEAARAALTERIGTAARDIDSPHGRLSAGPLWDLIHAAQLEATGADVSLAALPDPAAVIPAGPVTLRDVLRAYPYDNTLAVVELTGAQLRQALERSARAWAPYTFAADRPLLEPGAAGYNIDGAQGVTYEVDLTRPAGERIINLMWHDQPLAPEQRLAVAVNSYRLNGGGGFEEIARAPRLRARGPEVREALAAYIRRAGTLDGDTGHAWTVLPDYAPCVERPLVDLLVRQGAVPRDEALHLFPGEPARRADLGYWLARAFGWREKRLSGAFADAPDPLEPWLDGLLKRGVLGQEAKQELFQPFAVASLDNATDWCVAAARAAGYALGDGAATASFRRGLLTGTSLAGPAGALPARRDTLSVAQVMGMVANTRFPTVRVLETTDFHGALLPGAKERSSGRALGGSPVLAAWIARLRAENPEGTILLDGGDAFQGTMISNLQFGRPVVEQMNLLGYSGFAVGNHDFDWSADTLERRVDEMRFAAFGANLLERRTGRMPRWVRSDTLLVRRGVRVALFGLAYVGTPYVTLASNVARMRFADDSATAARLVPALRKRTHPHLVIEIGHTPGGLDSARRVDGDLGRLAGVPGVDLWMGGHSHNHLLGEAGGATVMIPGWGGQAVGLCDLTVDPVAGRVVERRSRLQSTYADEVVPDSAMLARVAGWNAGVALVAATPIGHNARTLTRSRGGESVLGDLVTDAMRAASGADFAFTNSGGLRADLAEGTVTKGSIYEVIPFDNTLVLVKLTGTQVRDLLEGGLTHGRISPQSGLRYRFDLSRPQGQRLLAVTLADGSPLDEARTYTVAVNNFMASGGDNYDTLARIRDQVDTGILMRDALERHIIALTQDRPLDVKADGRIEGSGDRP